MLISRVPEEGAGEGREAREDNSHEYETAAELLELIAKKHTFTSNSDPLKSDLVILYKNFDLGSRLMATPNDRKAVTRSNQRVEDIVHSGEDIDSDMSEVDDVISSHDLPATDIFLINKERIDLLNNPPSIENTLCHKFGDLEIKMSTLGADILFKTKSVKEQLDSLKLMSSTNDLSDTVLPSSLLDYMCCKRLEDNYNFYMENIIRYVKHTIEQLKRISNGDYLTEKVKEKWREIAEASADANSNKKILAASTSIPLHVERKRTGRTISWDDIVHSEMDIRSLSKILEKKIFLEVPKIICGSYRLFSKQYSDNLIISCEKKARSRKVGKKDSRVDVVLKLKRSKSGHVVSNIDSIMILQAPSLTHGPIIALPTSENKEEKRNEQKIVELNNETDETYKKMQNNEETLKYEEVLSSSPSRNPFTYDDSNSPEKSDTSIPLRDVYNVRCGNHKHYQEAAFVTTPDELSLSIQRLDIQSSLPEESIEDINEYQISKKKSPTKARIKSPYENKSHLIDEKKRKKLLEIRERREKRKLALNESCKIMKHRHGKGALTPQASSSVTKLSITNKSFYNSIYGQSANIENKQKGKVRKFKKDEGDLSEHQFHGETDASLQTPVDKSKKYTNKTYYLDETETAMMYMQMKGEGSIISASTSSARTADLAANLSLLSQQLIPSVADLNDVNNNGTSEANKYTKDEDKSEERRSPIPYHQKNNGVEHTVMTKSDHDIVPTNSPTRCSVEKQHVSDVSTVECRKSIEKLYDLLKNIGKGGSLEKTPPKPGSPTTFTAELTTFRESSDVQCSDSGTSLKHHLTSSETSGFSFNKPNNNASTSYAAMPQMQNRSTGVETNVVPKVIISTKCQTVKAETDKRKKDNKKVCFVAPKVVPENPLKAISQLLHEFDNAQKHRHKSSEERPVKTNKKIEHNAGGDRNVRLSPVKGRSRLDQHLKALDPVIPKNPVNTRDRRQPVPAESARQTHEKSYEKVAKKKISEIIDEAKEARGEAVRGPSKTSRLNTLAQPKKSYVQAHSEEYQTKYGRNLMADRLQRLVASAPTDKHAYRARPRRTPEAVSAVSVKPPPPPTIGVECVSKSRRSPSSSPASKRSPERRPDVRPRPELPEALKEKMVAVESYVKNHYGLSGNVSPAEPRVPKKSRVPLLPSDMDLASMTSSPPNEESTAIGSELHNIIDTMIKNKAPALSALSEGLEDRNTDEVYVGEDLSKNEDRLLPIDSDLSDIFKDNIHTAIEDCHSKNEIGYAEENITYQCKNTQDAQEDIKTKLDLQHYSSSTELQMLENALYRQMSISNFQKRLRIKNLTITPKQSMQHVVVVQSGDVGSVMLKSSMSQDFELKNCSLTNIPELNKTSPILTNPDVDWRRSPIPMQISTIGYAFPKYDASNAYPKIKNVMTSRTDESNKETRRGTKGSEDTKSNRSCLMKDYTCQTFKGQLSNQAIGCLSHCNETRGTFCVDGKSGALEKDILIETLMSDPQNDWIEKNNNKCDENTLDKENNGNNTITAENKNDKISKIEAKPEDIEYSTSLDMLVGLLNEIQKITQTQVLNLTESTQCRQLETILNNAATLENCVNNYPDDLVTISAIDKSKMLDSSPSSYSFYITKSDDHYFQGHRTEESDGRIANILHKDKPTYVDKEVSVDVQDRQYCNTFTNIPSGIISLPITKTTSTSVTNSLLGVLREPSSQSMFSCKDILFSDTLVHPNKIVELTCNETDQVETLITREEVEKTITKIEEMPKFEVKTTLERVEEEVEAVEMSKKKKRMRKIGFCAKKEEFDPLLKMKRDILVTVYSVLVLTVFAALSFPDVLYRV